MLINVKRVLGTAFALMGFGSAFASSVGLSDTTTSSGTVVYGTNSSLAVPGSYTYGDTFGAGVGATPTSTTNTAGFYDDYVFTIAAGSADSLTSTINLGNTLEIDGLQAALFTYTAGEAVPVSGTPLANGWSVPFSSGPTSGTLVLISPTTLSAGTYVLEIAGTVSGTAGGSYSGTLNLAPVPLPPGLPLLVSGIAALGWWTRRRVQEIQCWQVEHQ